MKIAEGKKWGTMDVREIASMKLSQPETFSLKNVFKILTIHLNGFWILFEYF